MYLGIDIGTSSVKAVIVDDKDTVVEQASAPLNVSRPNPWTRSGKPSALSSQPSALSKSQRGWTHSAARCFPLFTGTM